MEGLEPDRAFDDVFKRYEAALRRLVWSYAKSASDREDLFQEISLALWKALPKFRGDSSERTYVYRVAHNTAISFVTSRQRVAGHEELPPEEVVLPAGSASPEQEAIHSQRRRRLWAAVQDLSVMDRQIIGLYFEGLSTAEIEAVSGLPSSRLAMRLSRIKRRLAERLNMVTTGEGQ